VKGTAARRGKEHVMRAVFITYLVLIIAGLAYFTVIGLTHG
jgi:hypothetical protein